MGKMYAGSRLRRLRRERGLSQAALAGRLELSASYVNQMEHDVRPLSTAVLARLTEVFGLDAAFFSRDDSSRLLAEVRAALVDEDVAAGTGGTEELADFVDRHPGLARALVELHRRHRNLTERIALSPAAAAADGDSARHRDGTPADFAPVHAGAMPHEEVRDFFYARRNYLDQLDRHAEATADALQVRPWDVAGLLERVLARLRDRHGVTVREVDPGTTAGGVLHSFDPKAGLLTVSRLLDPGQRAFRLLTELAHLEAGELIDPLLVDEALTGPDSRALARRGLGLYHAAAVAMPYRVFHAEAERTGYDVELLCRAFGLGYETVASRLSTLQRPGLSGVPFTFIRVDRAGNVSKRQSATSFHLNQTGGTCPLWNVYEAFSRPGQICRQFAQMPDGRTYLWVARTVHHHHGSWGRPGKEFVVGLGCETRHAGRTVYASGFDFEDLSAAEPIGTGCRLCPRRACPQRAFPPVTARLEVEVHRSSVAPY